MAKVIIVCGFTCWPVFIFQQKGVGSLSESFELPMWMKDF